MLEIRFYDKVDDSLLNIAVIISRADGKWVFCKHKERDSYEFPAGHREEREDITETAKRELYEETGALEYMLKPVCAYSVSENEVTGYGMLFYAEINKFGEMPDYEMSEVVLLDGYPEKWTYREVQLAFLEKVKRFIIENSR